MPFAAAGEEGVSRGTIPRNSSFYRPAPLLAPQHSIKEGSNEEEDEAGHSSSYNTSGHNGTHAAAAPAAAAGAAEEEVNPPPPHVPLPAPHERSTDSGIGGGRLSSAVSSSIATTPRSSQQPPGAGGLAGGAAGGLLKKYTSLTTAATVDLEVKVRRWGGLIGVVGRYVVLGISVLALRFYNTNPRHTLNQCLTAAQALGVGAEVRRAIALHAQGPHPL